MRWYHSETFHDLPLSILTKPDWRTFTVSSQHSLPSFFQPHSAPSTFCYRKCQTLQGTSPTPPHIWSTVISQESEVSTNAFPVVVFPSPDEHIGLLNTCLWEVLLLRRFSDLLLYQALGHHPARLLTSHVLFTYLFVSQAYPAMSQSIPHQWPQDQDCLQVQSLWV